MDSSKDPVTIHGYIYRYHDRMHLRMLQQRITQTNNQRKCLLLAMSTQYTNKQSLEVSVQLPDSSPTIDVDPQNNMKFM